MSDKCLPDNLKHRARFVYRDLHQDEIETVRRRQTTKTFVKRLIERKWKIGGLFGEAKVIHSLRRARYRGLPKVQILFFMIAIALNCKRAVIGQSLRLYRLWCLLTTNHANVKYDFADLRQRFVPESINRLTRPAKKSTIFVLASQKQGLFNTPSKLLQLGSVVRYPLALDVQS